MYKYLMTLSLLVMGSVIAQQYPQVIYPRSQQKELAQPQQQDDGPQPLSEKEQLELMKKMGLADIAEGTEQSSVQESEVEYE
jgi:hypothetical protein